MVVSVGLMLMAAVGVVIHEDSTFTFQDTLSIVATGTLAGDRVDPRYTAVLTTLSGGVAVTRQGVRSSITAVHASAVPHPDGALFSYTLQNDTAALYLTGWDGSTWRTAMHAIASMSGYDFQFAQAYPCDDAAGGVLFCAFFYEATPGWDTLILRFVGLEYDPFVQQIWVHQDILLDTFYTAMPLLLVRQVPGDVPLSSWSFHPSVVLYYIQGSTGTCRVRIMNPRHGEIHPPGWNVSCPVTFFPSHPLPVSLDPIQSGRIHILAPSQWMMDTMAVHWLVVDNTGFQVLREDTFATTVITGLAFQTNGTDMRACVTTSDSAYVYPSSGSLLRGPIPSSPIGVFPTGQDEDACLFRTGTGWLQVRDNGGPIPDTMTWAPDFSWLYFHASRDIWGAVDGGVLWRSKAVASGDTVWIERWNLGDFLAGGSPTLVDTLIPVGDVQGSFQSFHVLQDTLYLTFAPFGPVPHRFVSMDSHLNIQLALPVASTIDTMTFGAPWMLWVPSTQEVLALDRGTATLRPGVWQAGHPLMQAAVSGDTAFLCYGNVNDTLFFSWVDLVNLTSIVDVFTDSLRAGAASCDLLSHGSVGVAVQPLADGARLTFVDMVGNMALYDVTGGVGTQQLLMWHAGDSVVALALGDNTSGTFLYYLCDSSFASPTCTSPFIENQGGKILLRLQVGQNRIYALRRLGDTLLVLHMERSALTPIQEDTLPGLGNIVSANLHEVGSYGYLLRTSGVNGAQLAWVDAQGHMDTLLVIPDLTVTGEAVVPQDSSTFHLYLVGLRAVQAVPRAVHILFDTTGTDVVEGAPAAAVTPLRFGVKGSSLVVLRGGVDAVVEVFSALGRRVLKVQGTMRSGRALGVLPVRGVYFVRWKSGTVSGTERVIRIR